MPAERGDGGAIAARSFQTVQEGGIGPGLGLAVIGEVGNTENNLRKLGKAGATRWRGVRPTVRGVVMNPVDHPHGGGEGRTSGGRHPVTPWGVPTKGHKTRKNKRTDGMIVRRRGRK